MGVLRRYKALPRSILLTLIIYLSPDWGADLHFQHKMSNEEEEKVLSNEEIMSAFVTLAAEGDLMAVST